MLARMVRGCPWARLLCVAALIGALSVAGAILSGRAVSPWMIAIDLFAIVAALGGGVFVQGAGLFARPPLGVHVRAAGDRVALTFDDGPDEVHTRAILDLLESRGHRATFFVIGNHAAGSTKLVAEIVRRGHALGNHSYTHSWMTPFWSVARLTEDLRRTQQLLIAAGARSRWFRPPVGLLSPRVVAAARRAATTPSRACARLCAALRPGAILVLHDAVERGDRAPVAPAALPRLLDELAARGLRSVTLDELFNVPGKV
jgi:peptidoglycan/xylan/chitin deacetylase (PgdA/CDA1 family)